MLKGCKKFFGEGNPSQSWAWKQKYNHSCSCCDDSRSCEQLKKCIIDKSFEKKVRLWTLIISKNCYHYNSWVIGVYMAYMFDRNSGEKHFKLSVYLKKFKVLWLLKLLYSALTSAGPQLQKQLVYKSWLGTSDRGCHLTPKIGYL